MAKRPTRPRHRSGPAPVNALGWRRLPGSSRNYRNVSDPRRPIGTTISERQMANLSREARLGRKITKEAYKKRSKKANCHMPTLRHDCDRPTPETAASFADICPKSRRRTRKSLSSFIAFATTAFHRPKSTGLAKCFDAIPPTMFGKRSAASLRISAVSGLRLETGLNL
jgi:hypothetical protein